MADVERIPVDEARARVRSGQALLVCGYEDESRCSQMRLEGSTTLSQLEAQSSLLRDKEIIFYCA